MLDQLMIFFEMLIIVIEAGHQERRSPVGGRPGHNLAQVWRMVHHPAVVVPDGHHRHHLHIIVIAGIIVEENITTLPTVLPHNLLHCFALLDAKRSAFSNLPSFLSQRKELKGRNPTCYLGISQVAFMRWLFDVALVGGIFQMVFVGGFSQGWLQ